MAAALIEKAQVDALNDAKGPDVAVMEAKGEMQLCDDESVPGETTAIVRATPSGSCDAMAEGLTLVIALGTTGTAAKDDGS